jgi:hypothetical protein
MSPTKDEAILWHEALPESLAPSHTVVLAAAASAPLPAPVVTLFWVMDGGGSDLATGISGDLIVDFDCRIVAAVLMADQEGDLVVDIWRADLGNYPPVVDNSITALTPPELDGAEVSIDVVLEDWMTALSAGDVLRFNIDSCTTITRATLALRAVKV